MAAPSSPDPQALAERLLEASAQIAELLRSEDAALANPRTETLVAIAARKRDLAKELHAASSRLRAHSDATQHWSAAQRDELRRALAAARAAVGANARTLGVKVETGRHLMDAVTRAVRGKTAEGRRYDPAARASDRPAAGRADSVLVNEMA